MSLRGPTPQAREELFDEDYLRLRRVSLRRRARLAWERDGITLVVVEKGGGEAVCGRWQSHFETGDVLVFDAGLRDVWLSAAGAELVVGTFSVGLEQLAPLLTAQELPLLARVAEALGVVRRHPALSPVARECSLALRGLPEGGGLNHRGRLLYVATLVIAEAFRDVREARSRTAGPNPGMRGKLEALSSKELAQLSVGALAERLRCTPRHLNRLFQQHFGMSVGALRMETRLLQAASLLRDPQAKVSNVARECGFGHSGLFNTCFKRRFGMCPSEWRRRGGPGSAQAGQLPGNLA